MEPDEERFMAFQGLIQWTEAVIIQASRVDQATKRISLEVLTPNTDRQTAILAKHTEEHFFSIAANKLIEYRQWIRNFDLCSSVDFSEIDGFQKSKIKDLRNMREHIIDYFQGLGLVPRRWIIQTPLYSADASSSVETMIGGRLDWLKFSNAAKKLLPALLAEPIPYFKLKR